VLIALAVAGAPLPAKSSDVVRRPALTCVWKGASIVGCLGRREERSWDSDAGCNVAIWQTSTTWLVAQEGFIGRPDVYARRLPDGRWVVVQWNGRHFRGDTDGYLIPVSERRWVLTDARRREVATVSGPDGPAIAAVARTGFRG